MSLVSWAKKELAKIKFQNPKRLLPPQPNFKASSKCTASSQVPEVVLGADIRCTKCQEKVAALLSTMNTDLESIVVHVVDKRVTLTRKPINHSS